MPKVSVIIPVYKAAPYIERCAKSLFEQTLDDMEFIFIDDQSPDDSIKILERIINVYPHTKDRVIIHRMDSNSGQAAARNEGLKFATGDYIIHCDPDDWVDKDFYEKLYKKAAGGEYDVVIGNFKENIGGIDMAHKLNLILNKPSDAFTSPNYVFYTVWLYLIKASVIRDHRISFFDGINYSEDWGFLIRILFYAKSISNVEDTYYHYRKDNPNSITSKDRLEFIIGQKIDCLRRLDVFFVENDFSPNKCLTLLRAKRDIKNMYLRTGDYQRWLKLFPETANYEFRYSEATFLYRISYLLSHYVGSWLMRLFYKLKK